MSPSTLPASVPLHCPGVAIIGGGPAGLMAAEAARAAGVEVDLFEAKASAGRKFLIAGRGGLNLTHGDPRPDFDRRYTLGARSVAGWLDAFDGPALRRWAAELGVRTFVGTSGRVFPEDLKAAPLLRSWIARLKADGVRFHMRHRWIGFDGEGRALVDMPGGTRHLEARAVVLALGGGFERPWTDLFRTRFAGAPLKPVAALWTDADGVARSRQGECVVSEYGLEGSLLYAIGADLRAALQARGEAGLLLDLLPATPEAKVREALGRDRDGRSLSEVLRRRLRLEGAKAALLRECLPPATLGDPAALAAAIKRLPIGLGPPRPIAEAISTAGGIALEAVDDDLAIRALPGWYACGEMLDWDAPTGGYLLTACFASGRIAGRAAASRAATRP